MLIRKSKTIAGKFLTNLRYYFINKDNINKIVKEISSLKNHDLWIASSQLLLSCNSYFLRLKEENNTNIHLRKNRSSLLKFQALIMNSDSISLIKINDDVLLHSFSTQRLNNKHLLLQFLPLSANYLRF